MAKEAASKVLSVEGREVQITHPDKLYFSSQARISKLDLGRYYLSVAPGALAGIRDRPIVLKRFVDGARPSTAIAESLCRAGYAAGEGRRLKLSTFKLA